MATLALATRPDGSMVSCPKCGKPIHVERGVDLHGRYRALVCWCGKRIEEGQVETRTEYTTSTPIGANLGKLQPANGAAAAASVDPLADYERAQRRAIELHAQWQGKEREVAELRRQASEAWVRAQKKRAALDEYLGRINGQIALPETEATPEPPKRKGHERTPEAIAKQRATMAAKKAAESDQNPHM